MNSSTAHSGIIQTIYKSRKTLIEYLKFQGYNIDDYDDFSIIEVNSMVLNNQLDMLVNKNEADLPDQPKRKAYVKYHLKKSLRAQYIDEFVEDLYNLEQVLSKDDILFVISKEEPNDSLMNYLKQLFSDSGIFVIVLSLKRLQFNILEHSLVPIHKKLNKQETDEVLKKYNISDSKQIPEISRFDPVAQAIGLKPYEVCKIIRPSKTAIEGNYFRYCLNI
tara:strand:+ start:483 stop:1142 length:660 start_codon:yes stop_codon:yes gene_type:complete